MKHIALASALFALLVFTGCGGAEPSIDETSNNGASQTEEVAPVETETVPAEEVVIEENGEAAADAVEKSMSGIEKELLTIYFGFDQFTVTTDMKERVGQDAKIANAAASDFMIKLEGNCDEWGSDEYNYALGLKRANNVKKALVTEGVDAGRITMVSYGESNPVCSDKTQECWAQNRRVDFKLLP